MKNSFLLSCLAGTALLLTGCGGGNEVEIQYYPVQLSDGGNWGMISEDGDVLFEGEFKERPTAVVGGMFSVRSGDTYSLYKAGSKPTEIAGGFKKIGAFPFADVAPSVKEDKAIALINKDGEEVVELAGISEAKPYFSNDLLVVKNEGDDPKWGAVNTKGENVIAYKYDGLSYFLDGVAVAVTYKDYRPTYYIVNTSGEEIKLLEKVSEVSDFYGGYALESCRTENGDVSYIFINKKGEELFTVKDVEGVYCWNSDFFVYSDGTAMGVRKMNEGQEKLCNAKFDWLTILPNGNLLARDNGNYMLVNKEGEKISDKFNFQRCEALGKGDFFVVDEGRNYMIVNKDGEPVNKQLTIYNMSADFYRGNILSDKAAPVTEPDILDYTDTTTVIEEVVPVDTVVAVDY